MKRYALKNSGQRGGRRQRGGADATTQVQQGPNTICVSTVEDTFTGEEMKIESSLVIACDGANSRVRKSVGIQSEGEETADTMMTIHFNADLRRVVGKNTGMLHWILDPEARGFIIAYDIEENHVLIHNIDPERDPIASFDPNRCMDIVKAAIGKDIPIDFQCSMPWVLRRKVASQYFKGRVVLAGDSAHSFPPTGGLGLNSGISDAHCLAYKISSWYHGYANLKTMLNAYEMERRPVAIRNAIQSVKNGRKIFDLLKAIRNTDPDPVIARREMMAALRDPRQLAKIQQMIADQAEHFDNLNRHLGYVYDPAWRPSSGNIYVPLYRRGARLVHAWIKPRTACVNELRPVDLSYLEGDLSRDKMAAWQYSILDVVPTTGYLLVFQGSNWALRARQLQVFFGGCRIPLYTAEIGKDFEFVDKVRAKVWLHGYGFDNGNALLIRPDQHIESILPERLQMQTVLDGVLYSLGI